MICIFILYHPSSFTFSCSFQKFSQFIIIHNYILTWGLNQNRTCYLFKKIFSIDLFQTPYKFLNSMYCHAHAQMLRIFIPMFTMRFLFCIISKIHSIIPVNKISHKIYIRHKFLMHFFIMMSKIWSSHGYTSVKIWFF